MGVPGTAEPGRWLPTAEAAARLGVKRETLYAYVSRGLLPRYQVPGRRGSRFLAADVERLAARGRAASAGRAAGAELVVRSGITEIRDGETVRYRGHDVAALVERATFEQVAELLWTGTLPGEARWRPAPVALEAARLMQAALPAGAGALDRLRVTVDAAGAADPLRQDLRPEAVRAAARTLLPTLVEALPEPPGNPRPGAAGAGPGAGAPPAVEGSGHIRAEPSTQRPGAQRPGAQRPGAQRRGAQRPGALGLAGRLWARLTAQPPEPGWVETLDAALVLLADHELAASTLAVRVAASARCDPYAVIACGLAAVTGPRHGAAALAVEHLLAAVGGPGDAPAAIAQHLRGGDRLPGFGHVLYREQDPRATLLLARLRELAAGYPRLAAVEQVLAVAASRGLPPPNVDAALAALTHLAGMAPGSAETVFALARCAGWFAHALEQYAEPGLLRPRAVYTGP